MATRRLVIFAVLLAGVSLTTAGYRYFYTVQLVTEI